MGPTWELPPGGRGRARRSLGHHRPHNLIPPVAAAAGALSRRRESRRPAEARPGPELPFPPRAPRERRRFPLRRRRRLPTPRETTTLRPASTGSPPTQATERQRGSGGSSGSWILAGTRCAACRDTESERELLRGPGGARGRGGPPVQRGPGGLPPAAAPSAGSLRPPPPPPSSAAAAAGKGAEETASLPLPTAHAHAQHGPTVRTRATSGRKAPARPASGAPRAEGRGYGGPEGSQGRPSPRPAQPGLRPLPTCRCSSVSSPLCFPLPRHPHSN